MSYKITNKFSHAPVARAAKVHCELCLDTGLINRDATLRLRASSERASSLPWARLVARFAPCPACEWGRRETELREAMLDAVKSAAYMRDHAGGGR